jgi:dTDP-glucose 4,6-dehydratase
VEGEIYNIAGGNERPNLWIVDRVVEQTACDPGLKQFVTDRPGHDFRYAIDDSKVRDLGWEPRMTLETGLKATVDWYQEHRTWWHRIKSGEFAEYYRSQYAPPPSNAPGERRP